MSSEKKFGVLRVLLKTLGLSQEAVDDVVDWIADLLTGDSKKPQGPQYPYNLRDNFLSAAELSFYRVLATTLNDSAAICTKVGLGDLFWVSPKNKSIYRTYTNKIDRKHVDFLICDPTTMRPLVGIELDDKSHQRADRRERDEFVDGVFNAAGLPLLHVPARRAYKTADVVAALSPYLPSTTAQEPAAITGNGQSAELLADKTPRCPTCGGEIVLRTARSGANAGNQFWGCSNYPQCRGIVNYEGQTHPALQQHNMSRLETAQQDMRRLLTL